MSDQTTADTDTIAAGSSAPEERHTDSLLALIARIQASIEAETTAIRSDPEFDVAAANRRKSRHLYELGRAFKGVRESELKPVHREAMSRLREELASNEASIKARLSAVGEVASLLQDAIERAQADGTYTAREFAQG